MTWWLRLRRWPSLALAVTVVLILGYKYGNLMLPVPPVFKNAPPVPLAALLPIVLTSVVMASLPEDDEALRERTGSRPVTWHDASLILAALTVTMVIPPVIDSFQGWPYADLLARNSAGLVGIALLLRVVTTSAIAGMATAAYALACTIVFVGDRTAARSWAWPIDLDNNSITQRIAITLAVLGLISVHMGPGRARQFTRHHLYSLRRSRAAKPAA